MQYLHVTSIAVWTIYYLLVGRSQTFSRFRGGFAVVSRWFRGGFASFAHTITHVSRVIRNVSRDFRVYHTIGFASFAEVSRGFRLRESV